MQCLIHFLLEAHLGSIYNLLMISDAGVAAKACDQHTQLHDAQENLSKTFTEEELTSFERSLLSSLTGHIEFRTFFSLALTVQMTKTPLNLTSIIIV